MNMILNYILCLLLVSAASTTYGASILMAEGEGGHVGGGGGGVCLSESVCLPLYVYYDQNTFKHYAGAFDLKLTWPQLYSQNSLLGLSNPNLSLKVQSRARGLKSVGVRFSELWHPDEQDLISAYVIRDSLDANSLVEIILGREYSALMNFAFKPEQFRLMAYSDADYSFLLPVFFKLNLNDQAQLILHEKLFRSYLKMKQYSSLLLPRGKAIEVILQFDRFAAKILDEGYAPTATDIEKMNQLLSQFRLLH